MDKNASRLTRASSLRVNMMVSRKSIKAPDELKKFSTRAILDSLVVRPNFPTPIYSPAPKISKLLTDYINSPTPPKIMSKPRLILPERKSIRLPNLLTKKTPRVF